MKKSQLEILEHLSVFDFAKSHIRPFADYWYHSPPGFIESRGVIMSKLGTETEFIARFEKRVEENDALPTSKSTILTVAWDGMAIGAHPKATSHQIGLYKKLVYRFLVRA